jgi:acetyl esterase/lipase
MSMCGESVRTRWKRHSIVAAVAAIVATMAAGGQSGSPGSSQPRLSRFTLLRDIEYVPGGYERQRLDLYLPQRKDGQDGSKGLRPLIIWVHGGAWRSGSKDRTPAVRFVDEGYAVASVNYRLSQHAVFPAQI